MPRDLDADVAVRAGDDLVGDDRLLLLDLGLLAAHEALDREDRVLGVHHRLALGDRADQPLAGVGEGDHRRGGAPALGVLEDRRRRRPRAPPRTSWSSRGRFRSSLPLRAPSESLAKKSECEPSRSMRELSRRRNGMPGPKPVSPRVLGLAPAREWRTTTRTVRPTSWLFPKSGRRRRCWPRSGRRPWPGRPGGALRHPSADATLDRRQDAVVVPRDDVGALLAGPEELVQIRADLAVGARRGQRVAGAAVDLEDLQPLLVVGRHGRSRRGVRAALRLKCPERDQDQADGREHDENGDGPLHSLGRHRSGRRRRRDTNQPPARTGRRTGRAPRRGTEAGGGKSSTSAALGAQPALAAALSGTGAC